MGRIDDGRPILFLHLVIQLRDQRGTRVFSMTAFS